MNKVMGKKGYRITLASGRGIPYVYFIRAFLAHRRFL